MWPVQLRSRDPHEMFAEVFGRPTRFVHSLDNDIVQKRASTLNRLVPVVKATGFTGPTVTLQGVTYKHVLTTSDRVAYAASVPVFAQHGVPSGVLKRVTQNINAVIIQVQRNLLTTQYAHIRKQLAQVIKDRAIHGHVGYGVDPAYFPDAAMIHISVRFYTPSVVAHETVHAVDYALSAVSNQYLQQKALVALEIYSYVRQFGIEAYIAYPHEAVTVGFELYYQVRIQSSDSNHSFTARYGNPTLTRKKMESVLPITFRFVQLYFSGMESFMNFKPEHYIVESFKNLKIKHVPVGNGRFRSNTYESLDGEWDAVERLIITEVAPVLKRLNELDLNPFTNGSFSLPTKFQTMLSELEQKHAQHAVVITFDLPFWTVLKSFAIAGVVYTSFKVWATYVKRNSHKVEQEVVCTQRCLIQRDKELYNLALSLRKWQVGPAATEKQLQKALQNVKVTGKDPIQELIDAAIRNPWAFTPQEIRQWRVILNSDT